MMRRFPLRVTGGPQHGLIFEVNRIERKSTRERH